MKYSLSIILVFLISTKIFSQEDLATYVRKKLAENTECDISKPLYYSIRQIDIYEDMSLESAISGEIQKGEKVYITNSFFGENGWWEICYDGKKGWVKKALLSRKTQNQKPDSTKKINEFENEQVIDSTGYGIEVEFNPFLAKTNSSANFRTAPSKKYSHVIRKVLPGTQLYVFSDETKNGFYKVIDIKSAKIGWISKELINKTGNVNINSTGAFQSTGTTSEYESSVSIKNKSSSYITLIVGKESFELNPTTTDIKSISPGKKYYIATAPGVIPVSGYQTFESYHGYLWEFWIETKY